jgi:hypothetical protein
MTVDEEMVAYAQEVITTFGQGKQLSRGQIVDAVNLKFGRTKGSIIPSDYCYNRINNGIPLSKPALFVHVERSQYKIFGENYPYNGDILHKPMGSKEIVVGQCINGKRVIDPDRAKHLSNCR